MTRWLAALFVLFPLAAWAVLADEPDPEPPPAGTNRLDGEWELIAIKFRGTERKVPLGRGAIMIIRKGKITRQAPVNVKGKLRDTSSTFKIDTRKSPAHIDITVTATMRTTYGIFKLEGDQLTLSSSVSNVAARPKDFESATAVMVYKRKKK